MKKLFFAIGVLLSNVSNAQKYVEIEVNFMFEFLCDSKENYKDGFALMSTPSYNIDAIRLGSNKIKLDLINKTMINDSEVDGVKLHEEYVLQDLKVKNDTISFILDNEEIHEGKFYKFKSCFMIALNANDSDVAIINTWYRDDLNRIEGTNSRKKSCNIIVR